jgi:cyclomaltodextrinase / maltogenic alpha-amylase / neopullulanase
MEEQKKQEVILSTEAKKLSLGKYQHYKGHIYDVIGIAKHSETLEELVIYKDESNIWARPLKMFLETIEINGKKVPRFKKL